MKSAEIMAWYAALAPRDQRILRIGAVAALLIIIAGLALPLQLNLMRERDQLRDSQAHLEWMQKMAPTLAAAGPGQPAMPAGNQSLVVLIDTSARESGLAKALTGSTPAGNGAMRVQFENADFNLLLGWLHRLSTQHGLHIEDANVTGKDGAGLVNASVQVRPAK